MQTSRKMSAYVSIAAANRVSDRVKHTAQEPTRGNRVFQCIGSQPRYFHGKEFATSPVCSEIGAFPDKAAWLQVVPR
eukprot:m.1635418 g.1635418  ORF g.1635418 m.1635418 type:complete len:77 (+) comp25421_c1_seq9:4506-4736(+)